MNNRTRSALYMASLIFAGEAIFALPFHVARFFRSTFLEVFEFTNTQLGDAQSIYGVLAIFAYFVGGPLADRFPARRLLVASLLSTAAGGLYMATFPDERGMTLLFGYFGVTTILLFWAALIRATRDWGDADEQGRAFGILDGGRGALAAVLASAGALLFSMLFPEDASAVTDAQRASALRMVIFSYTGVTLFAAVLVWLFVPERPVTAAKRTDTLANVKRVGMVPAVWLQALIVICAYTVYKGADNYSLFAVQGFGLDEVEAAKFSAVSQWTRPVAALAAGILGDRFCSSKMIAVLFSALIAGELALALVTPGEGLVAFFMIDVLACSIAFFGLRGLYFALFEEAKIPVSATGTAVGFVSVIGYTPDIFVPRVGGWILDRNPGAAGHQDYYAVMAGFAALGLVATLAFRWFVRSNVNPD